MTSLIQIRTAAAGAFRALRLGVLTGALLGAAPAAADFSRSPAGSPAQPDAHRGSVLIALAPVDDRQGDRAAAAAVEAALREELAAVYDLVPGERLRDAQRRDRIRSVDGARAQELASLGRAVGAERIVTVTLHQGLRRTVPRVALSGRAYDMASGELLWAGFESASGLDGRTLLGLGVVEELDELAGRAGRRLIRDYLELAGGASHRGRDTRSGARALGRVAVIPLGAVTDRSGTNAAETATEALRAVLFRSGVDLASPVRVAEALRELRFAGWGGIDAASRRSLRSTLAADHLITGSVESYEAAGSEQEPEPRVALGLRLLDAASGRIVWTGGGERGGWDGQGPFQTGRTYARGELTEQIIRTAVGRLLDQRAAAPRGATRTDFDRSIQPDEPDPRGTR